MYIAKVDFQKAPLEELSRVDSNTSGFSVFNIDDVRCIYVNEPKKIGYILDDAHEKFVKEFGYKKSKDYMLSEMFSTKNVWPTKDEFIALDKNIDGIVHKYLSPNPDSPSIQIEDLYSWCKLVIMELFTSTLFGEINKNNGSSHNLCALSEESISVLAKYIMKFPEHLQHPEPLNSIESKTFRNLISQFNENTNPSSTATIERSLTTIFAGYEQMASIMFWCILILSQNTENNDSLDLTSNEKKRYFLNEVIRLHSPIWVIMRRPKYSFQLFGLPVTPDDIIVTSPWVMGRNKTLFEDPEHFNPNRWEKGIEKFAFFPFSHGARVCKGERYVRKVMYSVIEHIKDKRIELISHSNVRELIRVSIIPEGKIDIRIS